MDQARDDIANVDDEIDGARAAFAAALQSGDATAASALYAGDARLLAPSAELVQGREAIEAFWRAGVAAGLARIDRDALSVERHDGLAFEIGRYALRLQPAGGGTVVDRGKYLLVHQRQPDGSWRWAVEMFNPEAPPEERAGPAP